MVSIVEREAVNIGDARLPGELIVPADASGLVLFVHGSGSSRHSPRNQWVAGVLQGHHLATLLFDLLSDDEAGDRRNVFDIDLLSLRVGWAMDWAAAHSGFMGGRVGLFGASTGAAAALVTAAERPAGVGAVVSRGGRPDLATAQLAAVTAPTLLIVGGADAEVLDLNRAALRRLRCKKRLEVVPGASHLFEEPGALGTAAELAAGWFVDHLIAGRAG